MRDLVPELRAWLAELRERRVTEVELTRLCGPIGLDLGHRTPEETAVSIAARWGGTGRRLRDLDGRIHREPMAPTHPEEARPTPAVATVSPA